MKLSVIMANDFPAGVMDDEAAAEALVKERNEAEKIRTSKPGYLSREGGGSRVFWHCYPFTLNEVGK